MSHRCGEEKRKVSVGRTARGFTVATNQYSYLYSSDSGPVLSTIWCCWCPPHPGAEPESPDFRIKWPYHSDLSLSFQPHFSPFTLIYSKPVVCQGFWSQDPFTTLEVIEGLKEFLLKLLIFT